jgi:hypothetical protein
VTITWKIQTLIVGCIVALYTQTFLAAQANEQMVIDGFRLERVPESSSLLLVAGLLLLVTLFVYRERNRLR